MSLIVALILGGIIGWLAALIMGRNEGVIGSVVIGIVGSVIGSLISSVLSSSSQAFLNAGWASLVWSFIGAIIFVAILNSFQRHSHSK